MFGSKTFLLETWYHSTSHVSVNPPSQNKILSILFSPISNSIDGWIKHSIECNSSKWTTTLNSTMTYTTRELYRLTHIFATSNKKLKKWNKFIITLHLEENDKSVAYLIKESSWQLIFYSMCKKWYPKQNFKTPKSLFSFIKWKRNVLPITKCIIILNCECTNFKIRCA